MAESNIKENPAAQEEEGETLEGGSYDVIRARLIEQGKELAKRSTALNETRKETFGGTELTVMGNVRVRTENACVPCDIVEVAGKLLFSYNVKMGLKEVPSVADAFALQNFVPGDDGHSFEELPLDAVPGLLDHPNFQKEFNELYRYTKSTRLLRLKTTDIKILAVFQIGERTTDIKVFHWNILPDGSIAYADNRGDDVYKQPPSHEIVWIKTGRDDQRGGVHPHVSIEDRVFVETVGGDLTIKIEDNTDDGLGMYREPVQEPDQILDDAKIEYACVGPLILIRVLPYRESDWRYFVFNERTKHVVRIDSIGQACQQLPQDHGIVFPGGYYLTTGDYKQFAGDIAGLEFEVRLDSPNGEDVLYVYHRRDEGRYVLLPYNLIRKEVQNPIQCHGYSIFADGKLVVFRASDGPTRLHPMQIWQTPFVSQEFAAAAPTDGSYLAKVGNSELVSGISEAFSIVRLVNHEDPRRETYEDLISTTTRLLDNYYWLDHEETLFLAQTLKEVRSTGELIIDEFEKVVAIRKRARESLAEAQAQHAQLLKSLRPEDWKTVDKYMEALTSLRTHRGHVITLRDVRAIDVAALDILEKETVDEFERISKACVEFLIGGDALAPLAGQLDEVLARVEAVDNAIDLEPIEQEIEALGNGLTVLAEVVSGLQVGDAVARTTILENISEVMAHHGRVRATFKAARKELLTREGRAEFSAQFKLFAQTVSSAISVADTPEKCDDQLTHLLVQLEELEGRFSEFDEFLGDLAAKREEVHDALGARKQTLLDERQTRVQNLLSAAERILEGVARRAQNFDSPDDLNAYFAADAMVLKIRELVDRLNELGGSVKAEEILAKLKSSKQNALRSLRDKTDLFEDGANIIKFGRHRFSVNTQVLDLTILPRGDEMAIHLGGTDFYEVIQDEQFTATKPYWKQQIVSETPDVYRGEYLAASILFAAEAGAEGLSLGALYEAGRTENGLLAVVRKYAANRYDEGYDRGLHDNDATQILDKLLRMWATAGVLRISPTPRAVGCLFWAYVDDKLAKKSWQIRAHSLGRLKDAFHHTNAIAALASELGEAIQAFCKHHRLEFSEAEIIHAGTYLIEELHADRPRFTTSAVALDLVETMIQTLDSSGKRRAFEDDMRNLETQLRERYELALAWVRAFASSDYAPADAEFACVEAAVLLCTERKLDRDVQTAIAATEVGGLLGQHPRVRERTLPLRIDEFLERLGEFSRVRVPGFRAYRQQRQSLVERERKRLRLEEFKPKILSSFVRNRLVNEVYLPIVGDNLAKQLGATGDNKRTDQMGLLLLISPPGYGKTTLMEYVANRLGLVFMKVNGPALGHSVVSLDPGEAPNATAAQEVKKIGLSLEMGNNVMLYLDDIQHTHPELLQKFISLCDGTRRIEGVWNGETKTYDLRGKKFCVVMAGNPYTESGESFQIPDMLANRADTYNLGDILGGREEAFALSYIENAVTSNPTLAPLSGRDQNDLYKFVRMANGEEIASSEFSHNYSGAEIQEILAVLRHLKRCQNVLLSVNLQYIASAAMDDSYRTEPSFKLQGSYRNMNKLAEKVVAAMTDDEVESLIDDHYMGEAQTLTTEAEPNLLKLAEMRGRMTPEQEERWAFIKKEFTRTQSLGGNEDDPAVRVLGQLSLLGEGLGNIREALTQATAQSELSHKQNRVHQQEMAALARVQREQALATASAKEQVQVAKTVAPTGMPDWLRPQLAQLTRALQSLSQPNLQVQVQNEPPPGVTELLAQQVAIIERTLVPMVRAATDKLQDTSQLESRIGELLQRVRNWDQFLKQGGQFPV